jgi:hypothetical protein
MCRRFRALPLALALALTGGLVCVGENAGAVQPATLAQAGREAPPDDGPSQPDEERSAPSEDEIPGPDVPPRVGERRRIDPFDDTDEGPRTPHPATLPYPGHDVVVCEAGCDKIAGAIVFMKRRE